MISGGDTLKTLSGLPDVSQTAAEFVTSDDGQLLQATPDNSSASGQSGFSVCDNLGKGLLHDPNQSAAQNSIWNPFASDEMFSMQPPGTNNITKEDGVVLQTFKFIPENKAALIKRIDDYYGLTTKEITSGEGKKQAEALLPLVLWYNTSLSFENFRAGMIRLPAPEHLDRLKDIFINIQVSITAANIEGVRERAYNVSRLLISQTKAVAYGELSDENTFNELTKSQASFLVNMTNRLMSEFENYIDSLDT